MTAHEHECGHGHGDEHGHDHGHSHGHGAAPVAAPPAAPALTALTVTDKAAEKLKGLLEQEKKGPEFGLRLGVQGGGCSGLAYFMDFDTTRENDRVFEHQGARVFVDPKSILYMSGSVLDYTEGLMGAGFSIKNPMVKSSCGCGSSFTT